MITKNQPTFKAGIAIPIEDFNNIISGAVRIGILSNAIENDNEKAYCSYHYLQKRFSKTCVNLWLKNGKLKPLQVGNSIRYDKIEVEKLVMTDINRPFHCVIEY